MTTVGPPCPRCTRELPVDARYCPACGARVGGEPRVLRRCRAYQQLAGVCSGLAEYFDLDLTLVRVVYAVATTFTGFLPGVVLYVALAVTIPVD
jgi:phage shock protein PspC (stress-responsive transcriptional regulator)